MSIDFALSASRCLDCRACTRSCLLPDEMLVSPKALILDLGNLPLDKLSLCAACGYCRMVCPQGLDLGAMFQARKLELTSDQHPGPTSVRLQQRLSFSPWLRAGTQAGRGPFSHLAFMPGCSLCSYSPELVDAVYAHLQAKLPGIGLLISCCAKPSLEIGDRQRFFDYFAKFRGDLERLGASSVLTACSNCLRILQERAPDIQVRHLLEALDETGLPDRDYSNAPTAVLHDPCPTRSLTGLHDSARNILDKLRVPYQEFAATRELTRCCGRGGMLAVNHPQAFRRNLEKLAMESACTRIVSYCASCVQAFASTDKDSLHILDYVFGQGQPRPTLNLIPRWRNRLRVTGLAKAPPGQGARSSRNNADTAGAEGLQ